MSERTLTNVVNDQTVALNALIYGYAGHSLVTPQHAIQQIWWTEARINEKVTRDFVTSRLKPTEREKLEQHVGFGDLTNDTYIEWILEKARRLFLVLAEIGEADRIFAVVENSWDDGDLPLSPKDIEKLALANRRDDQANARFFHTQFNFLLRELRPGVHIDFAPNEEVPLEYVMGLPPAVSLQNWSRVHLPKKPNNLYVRRKFALSTPEIPGCFEDDFFMDVECTKMVTHDHIVPIWASYTFKDVGYVMTDFVCQHTLRSFIDHRDPLQYKKLPKPQRRFLVLGWLHCLADAVATLHRNRFCHTAIRPANILIDDQNAIAFSDIGSLETFQRDKRLDPMEIYIYGAPEAHPQAQPSEPVSNPASPTSPTWPMWPSSPTNATRKHSITSKTSSGSSNSNGSQRQKLTKAPSSSNDFSGFNFGFKKGKQPIKPRSNTQETEQADVYSLGCVFLEMITFMLKKKPHDFVKHRSSKQRVNVGGRVSRTDSSFHANPDKVESWMRILEDFAAAQQDSEGLEAVPYVLNVIRDMLTPDPDERPSALLVRDQIFSILCTHTPIPDIHCGAHMHDIGVAETVITESDRNSSVVSLRPLSISTQSTSSLASSLASSDTDTIRSSIYSTTSRVHSILDSYTDRSVLSGIREQSDDEDFDDGVSILTTTTATTIPSSSRRPPPPPVDTAATYDSVDTAYTSPRKPPTPPISPRNSKSSSSSPPPPTSPITSPMGLDRSSSPSSMLNSGRTKSWGRSKPRLLFP
ncbi:kinase-like protein [Periconia macrospinosa]|uniref:non-specific serine/threonine protein kinase n=1 Tax=Periconia macrospinosa TaxID=97972 RepID=A0A2V1E320_9PLEO|nr:kinase-like protein [Periconia macrospinosa]